MPLSSNYIAVGDDQGRWVPLTGGTLDVSTTGLERPPVDELTADVAAVLGYEPDGSDWPHPTWRQTAAESMARFAGQHAGANGVPLTACPFPPSHPAAGWWTHEWIHVEHIRRTADGTINLTAHELTLTDEERAQHHRDVGYVSTVVRDPAAEILDGWEPTPAPAPAKLLDPVAHFYGYDPVTWAAPGPAWAELTDTERVAALRSASSVMQDFADAFVRLGEALGQVVTDGGITAFEKFATAISAALGALDIEPVGPPIAWEPRRADPLEPDLTASLGPAMIDVASSFAAALPPRPDWSTLEPRRPQIKPTKLRPT